MALRIGRKERLSHYLGPLVLSDRRKESPPFLGPRREHLLYDNAAGRYFLNQRTLLKATTGGRTSSAFKNYTPPGSLTLQTQAATQGNSLGPPKPSKRVSQRSKAGKGNVWFKSPALTSDYAGDGSFSRKKYIF